eukprot:SAG31_NODE_1754_length_7344_cov_20.426639_1_plen_73_part_00
MQAVRAGPSSLRAGEEEEEEEEGEEEGEEEEEEEEEEEAGARLGWAEVRGEHRCGTTREGWPGGYLLMVPNL